VTINFVGFASETKSDSILLFGGQQWIAMRFGTISRNGRRALCPTAPGASAARARTTGCFSMRSCGWPVRVAVGGICRSAWRLPLNRAGRSRRDADGLARGADLNAIMWAHHHAAAARRLQGDGCPCLARSRSGLTTKIHAAQRLSLILGQIEGFQA